MRALGPVRGGGALVAAVLAYSAMTVAEFHNLLPSMATALCSSVDDPLLNTSILAWNAKHVPLTSPPVWIMGKPVIAYNALLMICFVLNGAAMFALACELTHSTAARVVGGFAFALAPYQAGQVAHVPMLLAFGTPLAPFGLHRFMAGSRRSGPVWFTCGWLALALAAAASTARVLVEERSRISWSAFPMSCPAD